MAAVLFELCLPPPVCVTVLRPMNVNVFGDRLLKEIIKLKRSYCIFVRENLYIGEIPGMYIHRKSTM